MTELNKALKPLAIDMSSIEKKPEDETPGSVVVGSSVPSEIAEMIRADARADDRNPSYIIRQILVAHYSKRTTSKTKARKGA